MLRLSFFLLALFVMPPSTVLGASGSNYPTIITISDPNRVRSAVGDIQRELATEASGSRSPVKDRLDGVDLHVGGIVQCSGVAADGATNDYTALLRCFSKASPGGIILLPRGRIRIEPAASVAFPIQVGETRHDKPGLTLAGTGMDSTIIDCDPRTTLQSCFSMINDPGRPSGSNHHAIQDLTIKTTSKVMAAIELRGAARSNAIRNVRLVGPGSGIGILCWGSASGSGIGPASTVVTRTGIGGFAAGVKASTGCNANDFYWNTYSGNSVDLALSAQPGEVGPSLGGTGNTFTAERHEGTGQVAVLANGASINAFVDLYCENTKGPSFVFCDGCDDNRIVRSDCGSGSGITRSGSSAMTTTVMTGSYETSSRAENRAQRRRVELGTTILDGGSWNGSSGSYLGQLKFGPWSLWGEPTSPFQITSFYGDNEEWHWNFVGDWEGANTWSGVRISADSGNRYGVRCYQEGNPSIGAPAVPCVFGSQVDGDVQILQDDKAKITLETDGDIVVAPESGRRTNLTQMVNIACVSSPPARGVAGDLYCDSDSNELCFHDGTKWTGLKTGGTCF